MHDYSRYYAVLRARPDTDWRILRAHYRRLIGQWHPDRFSSDVAGREIAEERSKEITSAYQALERYRRDYGVLPPIESATTVGKEWAPAADTGAGSDSARTAAHAANVAPNNARRDPATPARQYRRRVAAALCALVFALYLAHRYFVERAPEAMDTALVRDANTPTPLDENQPDERSISIGSTLGDVYDIQGVPTQTQGDSWYYGKSQIRFAQGKVVGWYQDPDNPLRVGRGQLTKWRHGYFHTGSTKDEVRAVQGIPIMETDTVWDYGQSRVYFERNRVVHWLESPLQPLRVSR